MQNKRQLAEAKAKMKTDSKKRKADKAFAEGHGNWESNCGCAHAAEGSHSFTHALHKACSCLVWRCAPKTLV